MKKILMAAMFVIIASPAAADFTEVPWSNGDMVTETKMDQMVDNDIYLRTELGVRMMVTHSSDREWVAGSDHTVYVKIDGTPIGTIYTGTYGVGSFSMTNADISGFSVGLHTLTVDVGGEGSQSFKIYISDDMDYLSLWISISGRATGSYNYWSIRSLTVLAHRVSQAW